jgi:RNA 3'-phosphate cyclase
VLEVDGSYGEGGGQILRTAVMFSVILGKPVRVTNIRAGREVPGLRQQHLSALQTLSQIFGAQLRGADVGASEISFTPGRASVTSAAVDMKTAASITLLLQAVVPAVALTHSEVSLEITGGTDVPWSPTFDYLSAIVRPGYRMLGIEFEAAATRRGYYPKGGGRGTARGMPSESVRPVNLAAPQAAKRADLVSRCGRLPRHVAERQMDAMAHTLERSGISVGSRTVTEEQADSPGSSVLAAAAGEGCLIGSDGLGARGVSAEEVGRRAAEGMARAVKSGASVDSNLADMLAPLLSLADGESILRVPAVSQHLKTSMHVAELFTGCETSFMEDGGSTLVTVRPLQRHNA